MRIDFELGGAAPIKFCEISAGETFATTTSRNWIYLKTGGANREGINAVDLLTGDLRCFPNDTEIFLVDSKLTVWY